MSHCVIRGKPNASQLYLDGVLNEILALKGVDPSAAQRDAVTTQEVLLHCLNKNPDDIFMINGATGEEFTNGQILKRAIPLARALSARGATGTQSMMLMRNHQHMAAVYFGVLFAGLKPFLMDPNTTVYELSHFLNLIEPLTIFCDKEFEGMLQEALVEANGLAPTIVVVDEEGALETFSKGHSDDLNGFKLVAEGPEDTVMYLSTSGSSGLPKAARMTHRGLVVQLPSCWSYFTQFPRPTELVMVLTTIQWMTFTMMITACPVYRIPLLLSPKKPTVDHVKEILEKFKPTWTFLSPAFASSLVPSVTPEQLNSLQTLILLGAPATPELMAALKSKLSPTAHLCDGYGTTETQGFIALPDRAAPLKSNGWVFNFFHYKIVDENKQPLGVNQTGELWVKGPTVIPGYHRNKEATDDSFSADGWYMTGDVFHLDETERLSFIIRKKFSFKYQGCQVAPEEVERVIESVAGVSESFVCGTDNGPTAAIVLRPDATVTKDDINKAVNARLSSHKRLHGGMVFVSALPHTHSGKLKRPDCAELLTQLIASGRSL